jgi:hypothetical protein
MLYPSVTTATQEIGREPDMMRKIQIAVFAFIASASLAQAAAIGGSGAGLSPLMILLIGFGATIIVLQLLPGIVLLASMLKGVFSLAKNPRTSRPAAK